MARGDHEVLVSILPRRDGATNGKSYNYASIHFSSILTLHSTIAISSLSGPFVMRGGEFGEYEDDDFDNFDLGQADLEVLAALEAQSRKPIDATTSRPNVLPTVIQIDCGDDDFSLDEGDHWDDAELITQMMEVENRHAHQQSKGASKVPSKATPWRPTHTTRGQAIAGPSSRKTNEIPSSDSNGSTQGEKLPGGPRQRTLFGEVLPMQQASQGLLLVAKKAHTATGTASQKVRDALNNKNHRFHMEGKSKRKEWDRSQTIVVQKSKTSSIYDDDEDGEVEFGSWGNDDVMGRFTSAPPPIAPDG